MPKAKLGGVDSFGMVLCGSKDEKAVVEILEPPADAEDGDTYECVAIASDGTELPAVVTVVDAEAGDINVTIN